MSAKTNIAKLPEMCYSVLAGFDKLIRINAGEMGYYAINPSSKHIVRVEELADKMNEKMGVTRAQRAAMETGSMFGWEVPGADPDFYNEDGSIKKDKIETI